MSPHETVFYQDNTTLVTSTRVIINGSAYDSESITSVTTVKEQPNRLLFVLTFIACLFFCSPFLFSYLFPQVVVQPADPIELRCFPPLSVIFFLFSVYLSFRERTKWLIIINFSTGEKKVVPSTNQDYVVSFSDALNQAIVANG